jgi:hypothetical protein
LDPKYNVLPSKDREGRVSDAVLFTLEPRFCGDPQVWEDQLFVEW